jgi:hypothetical protein
MAPTAPDLKYLLLSPVGLNARHPTTAITSNEGHYYPLPEDGAETDGTCAIVGDRSNANLRSRLVDEKGRIVDTDAP